MPGKVRCKGIRAEIWAFSYSPTVSSGQPPCNFICTVLAELLPYGPPGYTVLLVYDPSGTFPNCFPGLCNRGFPENHLYSFSGLRPQSLRNFWVQLRILAVRLSGCSISTASSDLGRSTFRNLFCIVSSGLDRSTAGDFFAEPLQVSSVQLSGVHPKRCLSAKLPGLHLYIRPAPLCRGAPWTSFAKPARRRFVCLIWLIRISYALFIELLLYYILRNCFSIICLWNFFVVAYEIAYLLLMKMLLCCLWKSFMHCLWKLPVKLPAHCCRSFFPLLECFSPTVCISLLRIVYH